jgi:hypothetical protein
MDTGALGDALEDAGETSVTPAQSNERRETRAIALTW